MAFRELFPDGAGGRLSELPATLMSSLSAADLQPVHNPLLPKRVSHIGVTQNWAEISGSSAGAFSVAVNLYLSRVTAP